MRDLAAQLHHASLAPGSSPLGRATAKAAWLTLEAASSAASRRAALAAVARFWYWQIGWRTRGGALDALRQPPAIRLKQLAQLKLRVTQSPKNRREDGLSRERLRGTRRPGRASCAVNLGWAARCPSRIGLRRLNCSVCRSWQTGWGE